MALLQPNATYEILGVAVKEKIIPDGTKWKDYAKAQRSGFSAGSLYKKQKKLSNNTGEVKFVTIHNTDDLENVEDDAEQYTRATYNENMNSVRIHFYVDDLGAWQNLRAGTGMCANDPLHSAEVSWHAGDGSTVDGGNMTSLSMEIIMNGKNCVQDEKAKDNGARLSAWLLWKNGLSTDQLVTHTYWVNKSFRKIFKDPDVQSTNLVSGHKWCPSYIFNSTKHSVALGNWKAFKALVQHYKDELNIGESSKNSQPEIQQETTVTRIKTGDLVSISSDAVYYTGKVIPNWVKQNKWYVMECKGDRAVIDKDEFGKHSICSPVNTKYLHLVNKNDASIFQPYLVKVKSTNLPIYNAPGTNSPCVGRITDKGVYTIVDEATDNGVSQWGKLKSGAGWILLNNTERL